MFFHGRREPLIDNLGLRGWLGTANLIKEGGRGYAMVFSRAAKQASFCILRQRILQI